LNKRLLGFMAIALLIGSAVGYSISWVQLLQLQRDVSELQSEVADLKNQVEILNSLVRELNDSINLLLGIHDFFFFQDPEFLNGSDPAEIRWEGSSWNFSSRFSGDFAIQDGLATLFYNENSGDEWGGTVLVQGKLPHQWGSYLQLLGGTSQEDAKPVEYVVFERRHPIPEGKFLLKAKVKVTERSYTVFGSYGEAVSNVGVDLMFGFDAADYDDPDTSKTAAIHADVILSRVAWDNSTKTQTHTPPQSAISPSPYDKDYHLTLIRGQITQLNTWYTFDIDLAEIINTIFNSTKKGTIRYYGAQVYADGIGSYTTAIFDYVKTTVDQ